MNGSTYKRKDGRWVGVVDIGTDGKRKQKYIYASTQKEARRKLNKVIYEIENGLFRNTDNTTFGSMLDEWHEIHSPKLAQTTTGLYRMYIDKHIKPEIGHVKLKDLKPLVFDKFYNKKLETLSPNTVIKFHKLIHVALNYAVKNNLIASNPSDNVTLPKKKKYKPKVYNEEKFFNLLKTVEGTFDEIPIMLAGVLGLRRGEIFGLRCSDINFKKQTISIEETEVRWDKYLIKDPKSETSKRELIAPTFLMQILRNYLRQQTIVPERICAKYRPGAYSERFKRLLVKNGLPVTRLHDLRHYSAVIMLKYGVSDKVAAERLGHSQSILRSTYQHVLKDMHEEAADKIEAVYSKFDTQIDTH